MGRAIALATPVFFLLIATEYVWGRLTGRPVYRLNDAVNSLSLGVISQIANLFLRALSVGIYSAVFAHLALASWPQEGWWPWALAIVFYDFCYYWNHRIGHESAVFWASHVVHHQSQCYNLSTALRQTSSGALLGWIFYLPMAIAGVPPAMFAVAAIVDLLYQYWIHTELVGKLGRFDRWFASPSNHRVHHAVNDRYIDRNYGGIFMLWDRLFGTFVEEDEPCVYGTRSPLDSWDPLWANLEVYAELARRSWAAERWRDRLLVWFMPPGWHPVPATAGALAPRPGFDLAKVRRYDPPLSSAERCFTSLHLTAAILATMPLLWFAEGLPALALATGSLAIVAVLWLTGAVMQHRLRMRSALLLDALVIGVLFAAAAPAATTAPPAMPSVVDDAAVQKAAAAARSEFLAGQPFDRLNVTVLLEDRDGRWHRGSLDGDVPVYPASCVKLAFLVAAVHWCREHGRGPDCLDADVRPMIVASDNDATARVVDTVSGVSNGPLEGADVEGWIVQRRYTELLLDRAGLLGHQRLFTKAYPTSASEWPEGLEKAARERLGPNAMSAELAAQLMLAIVSGAIEPQATPYMRALLRRPTFSSESALGPGLPPGSLYESKPGAAYDTLEEIMHAELPNGRRLIVAAFSNGWNQRDAEPWDVARLGRFTELLIDRLGLRRGLPERRYLAVAGDPGGTLHWALAAPANGRYEIAVWYPVLGGNSPAVAYVVRHAGGETRVHLDQTMWGSRWIKLGDFELRRGGGEVMLEAAAPGRLAAGPLRLARWPDQPR